MSIFLDMNVDEFADFDEVDSIDSVQERHQINVQGYKQINVQEMNTPRNHAKKNKTAKSKENMQILAIKSIENISKNAIHIA